MADMPAKFLVMQPVLVPQGASTSQAIANLLAVNTTSTADAFTVLVDVLIKLIAGGNSTNIDIANVSVPIDALIKDITAFKSIDWAGLLSAIEQKRTSDWADVAEVTAIDVMELLGLFIPPFLIGADVLQVAYPIIKWFLTNWHLLPSPPPTPGGGNTPDFPARPPDPPPPDPVPPPPGPINPNPVNPDYHPGPGDGRFSEKG